MQDCSSPRHVLLSLSTVMEIMFALHMSVKVNAVHTSDCPPISLCCKPSHRPAGGLACSRTLPKVTNPGPVIVFMAAGKEMPSLGNVKAQCSPSYPVWRLCHPSVTLWPAMTQLCSRAMSQCAPHWGQG